MITKRQRHLLVSLKPVAKVRVRETTGKVAPVVLTPEERSLRGKIAQATRLLYSDPREMTAAMRAASRSALERKLLADIDPEGKLTEAERAQRLAVGVHLHYLRLSFASAKKRRSKSARFVKKSSAPVIAVEPEGEVRDADA